MTSKNTPGALTVGAKTGHNANHIYADGDDAVAQVYGIPSNRHVDDVDPIRYREGLAIAARIVLTWNCHDALVAALKAALDIIEGHEPENGPIADTAFIRDAIAAAERSER